jgi:LacI family transcriptional regulator
MGCRGSGAAETWGPPMKPHYTIKDIARELNLSTSTVSRAINDQHSISPETKARVQALVAKVDFRINSLARNLRGRRSNIIGLIVPKISMYYQATVITAIQQKLQEYGYPLMIFQTNESPALERNLVDVLYTSRVSGLIISASLYTEDFSFFDHLAQADIPLVCYDRVPGNYPVHKIKSDEYQGGLLATRHLLEQGCRRIAIISGLLGCKIYQDRFWGYQAALAQYGLAVNQQLVFQHELTEELALRDFETLFSGDSPPDGIFACNDTSAIAVVEAAKKRQIAIPGQLKVVGYSNDPRTRIIEPAITTVEQFPQEVGEQAATLLVNLIRQKIRPGKSFVSMTTPIALIKRASSGG